MPTKPQSDWGTTRCSSSSEAVHGGPADTRGPLASTENPRTPADRFTPVAPACGVLPQPAPQDSALPPGGAPGAAVDVDAIRARCEAATPGPWEADTARRYVYVRMQHWCASLPLTATADAEFAAHAREDVPALLVALAAAELEREAAVREMIEAHDRAEALTAYLWGALPRAERHRWGGDLAEFRAGLARAAGAAGS